jgi:hypothetical protein
VSRLPSWLLVLLLFGAFDAAAVYVLYARAESGKGMPAFSVYSTERDGLAECAHLLRQLQWEPVALTRPVQVGRQRGLLILAEPALASPLPWETPDLSENEARALLAWVEQGNTLLLAARRMNRLHRLLNVTVVNDGSVSPGAAQRAEVDEAGGYTEGVNEIIVEGRDSLRTERGLPLWWVGGQPGAVLLRHGKGRVLVLADPSLLTLRGLSRADNALFLYNVAALHARQRRVYFDEYDHGLRSASGFWGYLRHHNEQWAVLLVLLVVLVACWAAAVRLGPAVATPRTGGADAVAYASAVARIYQRAGARRLLAKILVRDFLAALTRHLRLRRQALPAEVLAAWRQQHPGASAQRLQGLLRGVAALRRGEMTERQLLAWAQAFDQFRAEVLRAH